MNYQRPTNLKKEVEAGKGVTLPECTVQRSFLALVTDAHTASEERGGKGVQYTTVH
jgi:hypothetical protein